MERFSDAVCIRTTSAFWIADSIRFVFLLVYSVVLSGTRDALSLCHLYSFSLFVAF